MHKYANAQMHKHTNAQMHKCSNAIFICFGCVFFFGVSAYSCVTICVLMRMRAGTTTPRAGVFRHCSRLSASRVNFTVRPRSL